MRYPNTFWKFVRDNPDKKWKYEWLSSNPSITWDIVQANHDKEWSYTTI